MTDTPTEIGGAAKMSVYRGNVLEPQGPLPDNIYWRRRALAVAVFVVAVIVIGSVIWAVVTPGSTQTTTEAAKTSSVPPDSALPPSQAASPGAKPGQAGSDGSGTNGAAGSSSNDGGHQPGASGSNTSGVSAPSGEASGSAPSTLGPIPGVTPGGVCPDSAIAVVVSSDKPNYKVGEQPIFSGVVTNSSSVRCSRDVGTGMQQILVYTLDGKRVWSSSDCSFQPGIDTRMLAPGQQVGFQMQWFGKSSEPKCPPNSRHTVGPGQYAVYAQLGEKRSDPITFNIVK